MFFDVLHFFPLLCNMYQDMFKCIKKFRKSGNVAVQFTTCCVTSGDRQIMENISFNQGKNEFSMRILRSSNSNSSSSAFFRERNKVILPH